MRCGEVLCAFDEDGGIDVEGEGGIFRHGSGGIVEIFRAHGEAVCLEPSAEMLGAWLVNGASEDAPIVVGVVADDVAVAMDVQHDRRDRGTLHRRRRWWGHTAGDGGGMAGRCRGEALGMRAELAKAHGRSGASGRHNLMMTSSLIL